MNITKFIINDTDLPASKSILNFTVEGIEGAIVKLYIRNNGLKYYKFSSNTFETNFTQNNILKIVIPRNGVFTRSVVIPTVTSDDEYDFHLFVDTNHNTLLNIRDNTASINSGYFYEKTIKQKANRVLTFSIVGDADSFQSMPSSVTLTKPPLAEGPFIVNLGWDVLAADSTDGGALEIERQPVHTDFYTEKTHASIGAGSSATTIYLDSIEGLAIGLSLSTIQSGSVSGSPVINSINPTLKSVELSVAQTWATGKNITFKGTGITDIRSMSGAGMVFSDMSVEIAELQVTLASASSSSTTITVTESHGVKIGAGPITGIGMDNTTPQVVTGHTYASNAFTVTSAQTLPAGTVLTIEDCGITSTVRAKVIVQKMPAENTTVVFNLGNVLTSEIAD